MRIYDKALKLLDNMRINSFSTALNGIEVLISSIIININNISNGGLYTLASTAVYISDMDNYGSNVNFPTSNGINSYDIIKTILIH